MKKKIKKEKETVKTGFSNLGNPACRRNQNNHWSKPNKVAKSKNSKFQITKVLKFDLGAAFWKFDM